jgi:hypothetical protein
MPTQEPEEEAAKAIPFFLSQREDVDRLVWWFAMGMSGPGNKEIKLWTRIY